MLEPMSYRLKVLPSMLLLFWPLQGQASLDFSLNPEIGALFQNYTGGIKISGAGGYFGAALNFGYQNPSGKFSTFLITEYLSMTASNFTESTLLYGLGFEIDKVRITGGIAQSTVNPNGLSAINGAEYWGGLSYINKIGKHISFETGLRFVTTTFKAASNSGISTDALGSKYFVYLAFPFKF